MVSRDTGTPPPRVRTSRRHRSPSIDKRRSREYKNARDKRARKSSSCSSSNSSNDDHKSRNRDKHRKALQSHTNTNAKVSATSSSLKCMDPHKRHRPDEDIIVHGIGKEVCLFCYNEQSFESSQKLIEHSRICHKDKMFRCILCDSPTYYSTFQDIRVHLQVGHKVGKPEHFVKCPATRFLKGLECEMHLTF